MTTPPRAQRIGLAWAGISTCVGVAWAARSLGADQVFPGGGEVVLAMWDGSYHARRALFSFENFPAVLFFDPYLAHPGGAVVPMPPLYDWLLAAAARASGSTQAHFERVAAWSSPVLGALTVVPVFLAGRICGGRGVGLGAAALYALLPAATFASSVGDPDHHAAVGLLGATALASSLALVAAPGGRRRHALALALGVLRAALALCWSGSLLLLGVLDGALALAAVARGRVDLLRAQAAGALFAALLIAPWVIAAPTPADGSLTATTLSWLHVGALVSVAAVTGLAAALEQSSPARSALVRGARLAGLAGLAAGALALLPPIRESLAYGLSFVAGTDTWAPRNAEQAPLFHWLGGATARSGTALGLFGGFAYAIPLTPLYALWLARDAQRRPALLVLAVWSAALGSLAVLQIRFGNEFAPAGCVGFALLLEALRRGAARRLSARAASVLAVAVGAALLAPAVAATHGPRLPNTWAWIAGDAPSGSDGPTTLVRFAHTIRRATPESAGYFDPRARPEYGVLVKPSHGHVVVYAARRATPASGFGPYVDAGRFERALRFFRSRDEAEALALTGELDVRYVVTLAHAGLGATPFLRLLHRDDGSSDDGWEHSAHFRLVAEGPPGGSPLWASFPRGTSRPVIPYKLFEIVEGALLVASAAPGTSVRAELDLVTDTGRRFQYRATDRTDITGEVRLRVPYASGPPAAAAEWTRALGPYRVRVGDRRTLVTVTEADVRSGAEVRSD